MADDLEQRWPLCERCGEYEANDVDDLCDFCGDEDNLADQRQAMKGTDNAG